MQPQDRCWFAVLGGEVVGGGGVKLPPNCWMFVTRFTAFIDPWWKTFLAAGVYLFVDVIITFCFLRLKPVESSRTSFLSILYYCVIILLIFEVFAKCPKNTSGFWKRRSFIVSLWGVLTRVCVQWKGMSSPFWNSEVNQKLTAIFQSLNTNYLGF